MTPPKHPAAFPTPVLAVLRKVVPAGPVLDPFGGVGKLGLLGDAWRVVALDIERRWVAQASENGCVGAAAADATQLPILDCSVPCVATSPCYGNRMADVYVPTKAPGAESHRTRRTYRLYLGEELYPGSAGAMQWGEDYRVLHRLAWAEVWRVLQPGGRLIVNCKDHLRDGVRKEVCAWHWAVLKGMGFKLLSAHDVPVRGDQNTARHRAQGLDVPDCEQVAVFSKPSQLLRHVLADLDDKQDRTRRCSECRRDFDGEEWQIMCNDCGDALGLRSL